MATTIFHPHERMAFRKRRVLLTCFGLLVLCLLGPILGFWGWSRGQSRRVQNILSAAAARGEPISGDELNRWFRVPQGELDASALWVAGIQPLIKPGYSQEAQGLPFVGDSSEAAQVSQPLAGFLSSAKDHAQKHAFSLEKFHAAAALGGHARLPVNFRAGVGTLLPYTQGARDAARLLELEICLKKMEGDDRGCAKSLLTLLLLSRCLEGEPCAISQNICSVLENIGVESLTSLLGNTAFTSEELNQFEQIIASRNANRRMLKALVGERVMGVSLYGSREQLRSMGMKSYLPVTSADLARYLEYIEREIAACRLEYPETLVAVEKSQAILEKESSEGLAMLTSELTKSLTPDFKKNFLFLGAKSEAKNRAALAAIAVERFRRATGKLPSSLAELCPAYLPAPPTDPFTGKPMTYRATSGGFAIYSVGENKVDDQAADLNDKDVGLFVPAKSN